MERRMVEIKKLPPGEAYGARDLQKWANNRSMGRAGVGGGNWNKIRPTKIQCKKCRHKTKMMISDDMKKRGVKFACARCGSKDVSLLGHNSELDAV